MTAKTNRLPVQEAAERDAVEQSTLARALLEAKQKVEPITKEKKGQIGKRTFSYAPLELVLEVVEPVLHKYGIVLTQPTFIDRELRMLCVRTTLEHVLSGEKIMGDYPVGDLACRMLTGVTDDGVVWTKEQEPNEHHKELGGGLTYARRNSLLSLLGIAPEDEDNDAEGRQKAQNEAAQRSGRRDAAPPRSRELDDRIAKFVTETQTRLLNCSSSFEVREFWSGIEDKLAFLRKNDGPAFLRLQKLMNDREATLAEEEDQIPE